MTLALTLDVRNGCRYHAILIASFKDALAKSLFETRKVPKGFPSDLAKVALRKLTIVHAATNLNDLKIPPSNNLEALKGDRKGQHSIRVNDQFRVCFTWRDGNAHDVEIVDYH